MNKTQSSRIERLKPLLFLLCLIPVYRWLYFAFAGQLGVDPARFMVQSSGLTTLVFLCLTLTVTPLRVHLALPEIVKWRRMLGLFTFFYACCHAIFWFWLDRRLNFSLVAVGVSERPFIYLGVLNLLMLTALALTSNQSMVRKLGRNWRRLHRLVYVVAVFAIIHMWQMQEQDSSNTGVIVALVVVSVLLLWRVIYHFKQAQQVQANLAKIKPRAD